MIKLKIRKIRLKTCIKKIKIIFNMKIMHKLINRQQKFQEDILPSISQLLIN